MSEPRLKSKLWVQSAIRLADLRGSPGMVIRRGDEDAGGILVVLRSRDGCAVLTQVRAGEGPASWLRASGTEIRDQEWVDLYVERQTRYDPDLWVLEFETRDFQPPFEARIVGE